MSIYLYIYFQFHFYFHFYHYFHFCFCLYFHFYLYLIFHFYLYFLFYFHFCLFYFHFISISISIFPFPFILILPFFYFHFHFHFYFQMHIEAAKMLAFSEEEFVKALEWGSWWSAPCVNLLTYDQSFYNIPFAKTVNKNKIQISTLMWWKLVKLCHLQPFITGTLIWTLKKGVYCWNYYSFWKVTLKVILYSYLILKKMNERITDS